MTSVYCLQSRSNADSVATGKHSVTIPSSLPAGQYLLRAEIVSVFVVCQAVHPDMGRGRLLSTPLKATLALNSCVIFSSICTPCSPQVCQILQYIGESIVVAIHRELKLIPQTFSGCAQVNISGGGSASPPKITIPGEYKPTDPGITVNIYNNLQSYTA